MLTISFYLFQTGCNKCIQPHSFNPCRTRWLTELIWTCESCSQYIVCNTLLQSWSFVSIASCSYFPSNVIEIQYQVVSSLFSQYSIFYYYSYDSSDFSLLECKKLSWNQNSGWRKKSGLVRKHTISRILFLWSSLRGLLLLFRNSQLFRYYPLRLDAMIRNRAILAHIILLSICNNMYIRGIPIHRRNELVNLCLVQVIQVWF
jgi:hypothetical protein